ncbi:alpha/beta hydrolase [Sandaracinus amylolyticus]|uniref:alpha/beta hydrolase n=1 Tax=Sandaracinus amylolyticus TaxID=927083 RepID=UPI00069CF562|nr:alpha/beta fold hydrolase [Sandaracinus amylolyticus]
MSLVGPSRPPSAPPPPATAARELACVLLVVLAVALPFVNGTLAGAPGPRGSIDLRYVLVVGGAALGMLAVAAWRVSAMPMLRRRMRVGAIVAGLLPVLLALSSPRDPLWVSLLTLEVVLGAPLLAAGAAIRFAAPGPDRRVRAAIAIIALLALLGPWFTLTWGLASVQLGIAPVRLAHLSPLRHANEEEVEIRSPDGTLLRGTYSPGRRGAGGVVVLHGISDGRTRMAGWSAALQERGYHALRIDWRAHGRSEGAVTTFADRERYDLEAAFDWLASRDGVDRTKMSVLATSMGAGIALSSTARLAPRGLRSVVAFAPPSDYGEIVGRRLAPLGPFGSVARGIVGVVARGLGHTSPLELSPARTLEEAPPVPVLLFHGDADRTIPVSQSQALAEHVPTVELHVLPGVGHDEIPAVVLDDDALRRRVLRFLRRPRILRDRTPEPPDDGEDAE